MIREFYKRLGITVNLEEEKKKFYNRLLQALAYLEEMVFDYDELTGDDYEYILDKLSFDLGVKQKIDFASFLNPHSFNDNLVVSELLLKLLKEKHSVSYDFLNSKLKEIIDNSLVDLGIIFENDIFIKRGAETLDRAAFLDPLDWLKDYKTTKEFFEGALTHYFRKEYKDSITNAYSALESLVKTVLDSDKRLDQSIPELLSKLNLPNHWNAILNHFCDYAHEFSSRHGKKDGDIKDEIDPKDAEAYIYFTGLMIRLIIQSI